jgi:Icc-related predicted phosphoesterase
MFRCLKQLEKQLKDCGSLPVLAVTHMLPVKDFCVPEKPDGIKWGFFNAFLGSTALEELYKKYPVRYAVCGHVHYRSTVERDGIRHICPCLGYHTEWPLYHLADERAQTHIRDALYILETP